MDKVRELESRLQEALREDLDLTVVGYVDLDATWRKIDEIKNEANEVISDLIIGASRDENGRFVSKNNISFDVDEIAAISSGIKEITDKAYARISVISAEERRKKDLFAEKFSNRRNVREAIRVNNSMINTLEAEIKSIKTQLGDPGLTDEMIADLASRGIEFKPSESKLSPEKIYYLENELKAKESSLQSFKDANEVYKHQEEKLTSEMEILRNGGKLEEVLEEEKVVENVENKTKVENETEEKKEETEQNMTPFEPIVPPVNFEPVKEEPKDDEQSHVIAPILPPEEVDTHEITPDDFPTVDESEPEKDEDEIETVIAPILPPDKIETDGLAPEDESEEEEKEEEDEEEKEAPIPVPIVDEEEEYEKSSAKPGLWKRVGQMLVKAAAFVSILGTAFHTGLLVDQGQKQHAETVDAINRIGQIQVDEDENQKEDDSPSNGDDKVEDTDSPTIDPAPTPDPTPVTPTPTPDPKPTPDPTPTPDTPDPTPTPDTPDPTPTPDTPDPTPTPDTPDPTPTPDTPDPKPTPDTPDPKPTPDTPDPKPDPGHDEEDDMHLDDGDVAYNEENGVYVDSDGHTYRINPDGSLTRLDDQELDHNNIGESIVGEDELNPEMPKEMPIIGNVTTGEDMTDEEIDRLDDAINSNPEDLLDESVSEKKAEPATAEDYTQAEEDQTKYEEATQTELDSWWDEITSKLDAVNDEEKEMHR